MEDWVSWIDANEEPRPMADEWARQEAYLQGALDMLFLLVTLDLVERDTRLRCIRCGELTDGRVEPPVGIEFPMCEGCQ